MWSYFLCSLSLFICFVSSHLTFKGVSLDIYKWSEVPFPANFSIGFSEASTTDVLVPKLTPAAKKDALAFISRIIKTTKVKGILLPYIKNEFVMDWIREGNLAKGGVPVGMLIVPDTKAFKAGMGNTSIYVQFDDWEQNLPYELSKNYGVAARVIDVILIICCFIWANFKLIRLIRDGQFSLNIAPICLCIEVAYNTIRLCRSGLLLHELTAPYPSSLLPDNLTIFLVTLSFTLNLSSGIFIIFFWLNLMKMKFSKLNFFDKAFWPAFVLIGLLFVLIVVFGSLVVGQPSATVSTTLLILGSITTFCGFIVAVLYFIIAHRVFEYTRNRSGSDDMNIIAIKIILSGFAYMVITAFSINQLIARNNPSLFYAHITGTFIIDIFYSVRSSLQIDVFGTIKKKQQTVVVMDSKENKDSNKSTTQ